jgi:hypothetical protein
MSLAAFDHIMLEDTFVLAWHREGDALSLQVLASLLPSHPLARPPANGEWACYMQGIVLFQGVSSVKGLLDMEQVRPVVDPDGTVDYGCIDGLEARDAGVFSISGEFGDVTVYAEKVQLELAASAV